MSSLLLEPIFPTLSQAHVTGDNLREFWKLCTKVKDSMQGGRRLENLFWRLWYRYSSPECSLLEQEKICSFFEKIEWRNNPMDELKKVKFESHKTTQQTSNTNSLMDQQTSNTTTAPLNVPLPSQSLSASIKQPPTQIKNQTTASNTSQNLTSAPSKTNLAPSRVSGFCVPSNSTTSSTTTTTTTITSSTTTTSSTTKTFENSKASKVDKKKKVPKKKTKFFIMSSSEDSESDIDSNSDSDTEIKKKTTTNPPPPMLPRLPSKTQLSQRSISTNNSESNSLFGKINPATEKEIKSALTSQLKSQRTPFNPFYSRMFERIERFDEGRTDLMDVSESLRMGLMIERQILQRPGFGDTLDAVDDENNKEEVLAW